MLIEFSFSNYRSFRDRTTLSLESFETKNTKTLPVVAIFGKNGGGKSNVIRAFSLAVNFICNAQITQSAGAPVPVESFKLDDYSENSPTAFEFVYVYNGVKYIYGFSATKDRIYDEYLFHYPKGTKAQVFIRKGQDFSFVNNKALRQLISRAVAENQLYFSVANTMNDPVCTEAMKFFRESVIFSRDFCTVSGIFASNYYDISTLKAMKQYVQNADIGINDIRYDINDTEVDIENLTKNTSHEFSKEVSSFVNALSDSSYSKLQMNDITARTYHMGVSKDGKPCQYELKLEDESSGTHIFMALAAAIDKALDNGGVLIADDLEKGLHPLLLEHLVNKFQDPEINKNHAQLIFTTHSTEMMRSHFLNADQFYFVDKERKTSVSELYSINDLGKGSNADIRTAYLIGKFGGVPELVD